MINSIKMMIMMSFGSLLTQKTQNQNGQKCEIFIELHDDFFFIFFCQQCTTKCSKKTETFLNFMEAFIENFVSNFHYWFIVIERSTQVYLINQLKKGMIEWLNE